jgi:hypothetical protein
MGVGVDMAPKFFINSSALAGIIVGVGISGSVALITSDSAVTPESTQSFVTLGSELMIELRSSDKLWRWW